MLMTNSLYDHSKIFLNDINNVRLTLEAEEKNHLPILGKTPLGNFTENLLTQQTYTLSQINHSHSQK